MCVENDGIPEREGDELIELAEFLALTGMSRKLLLSWERRYGLTPAARASNGRRLYSKSNARRFNKLLQAVKHGHRIGQIADALESELDVLLASSTKNQPLNRHIQAAESGDVSRCLMLLRQNLRDLGTERFVYQTVLPLLNKIGALWAEKKLAVAAEHVVSLAVRHILLGELLDSREAISDRTAIVATLDGEYHELGALSAALIARCAGLRSIYLGPSVPAPDIAAMASRSAAQHVIVSAVFLAPESVLPQLSALKSLVTADVQLIVGYTGDPKPLEQLEIRCLSEMRALRPALISSSS